MSRHSASSQPPSPQQYSRSDWGALRTLYPVGIDHHDLIDSEAVGEAGDLTREELFDAVRWGACIVLLVLRSVIEVIR